VLGLAGVVLVPWLGEVDALALGCAGTSGLVEGARGGAENEWLTITACSPRLYERPITPSVIAPIADLVEVLTRHTPQCVRAVLVFLHGLVFARRHESRR
jgi:hypothetical protein